MIEQGLQRKTIERHVSNSSLYINDFLLYEDAVKPEEGAGEIGDFLGYWFIKKTMWANKTAIKENAASLTKFYKFLSEEKMVTKKVLKVLKDGIKKDLPEWLATMERYDDIEIEDMNDVWGGWHDNPFNGDRAGRNVGKNYPLFSIAFVRWKERIYGPEMRLIGFCKFTEKILTRNRDCFIMN